MFGPSSLTVLTHGVVKPHKSLSGKPVKFKLAEDCAGDTATIYDHTNSGDDCGTAVSQTIN